MAVLPLAEWCPDKPDLATATDIALNVIPRTKDSYGPVNDLAAYSASALDSACIGAVTVQDVDQTVSIFAGTSEFLYQMTALSSSWVDVSGASYSTAEGDSWRFELYGRNVYATNFGDPIQYFLQGTSVIFADLSVDAPQARFLCTPKNFLMAGNTYDPVGGLAPARLWWSAAGDPALWPTPGSALAQQTMSDYNDFSGSYGEITGLVDSLASADVAIFFRHAVWRGIYVGPPDVFDFFPAENVRGCPCPNGVVVVGAMVYYPGEDGFYVFDGSQSMPIGADKFDKWFWQNVNIGYLWNVIGAADVVNKAVIWIFPSVNSSSGVPDTALVYRWDIQRASIFECSADWITRFLSFGATLDTLDSLGYPVLDTIPYSLDSRVWIGGALQMGGINAAHQLAYFSGDTLAAQVGTQTVQLTPSRKSWVSSARPLVQLSSGTPTISIGARNTLYDALVFGPAVPPDVNGECPQRSDNRYHEAVLAMPAGSAWTHMSGIDVTAEPSGER